MEKLSSSLENYLKTIYNLCHYHSTARVSEIAAKLEVSKASASRAVSILESKDLVCKLSNRTLYLTTEGMNHATLIINRHKIIKTFFSVILKVAPSVADKDACSFEHTISLESLQSMCRYLELNAGLTTDENAASYINV